MTLSKPIGIILATVLATMLAGCATQAPAEPEPVFLAIEPLPLDDEIVNRYTPRLTETSEDGRWSVTWLTQGRVQLSSKRRSRVVITDLVNGRHYDVPELHQRKVWSVRWTPENLAHVSMNDDSVVIDVESLDPKAKQVALDSRRHWRHGSPGPAIPNMAGGN